MSKIPSGHPPFALGLDLKQLNRAAVSAAYEYLPIANPQLCLRNLF